MRMVSGSLLLSVVFLVVCGLAGCGLGGVPDGGSHNPVAVGAVAGISGVVHGGQQPVTGSTIQLWSVGTTGYASSATALIPSGSYYLGGASGCVASSTQTCYSGVVTGAGGAFNITGDYNCTSSPNQLVYLTSTGGNPGLAAGTNNTALALMVALGPCSGLKSTTSVIVDEVTTVASVYALAQFMSSYSNVGSYSASTVGITNAFATVNNLVSTSLGTALTLTPAANGMVPQAEIDSLGNILASCVNTAGGTAGDGSACGNLFTAAKPSGGTAPVDTVQAMLDIALNPGNNVGTLYTLSTPNAPFQPTLGAAPNDWTMAVDIAGTGTAPSDFAIDAGGNIWVANYGYNGNYGGASEINNLGGFLLSVPSSGSPTGIGAIAIDLGGNAWVGNYANNEIMEIAPAGASSTGPFQFTETNEIEAIAVDGNNNVWLTNYGSVTEMSNKGASSQNISPSGGYTGGGLNNPVGIAIDASNNAWIANAGGNSLTKITSGGTVTGGFTGSGLDAPTVLAIDSSSRLWVDNYSRSDVAEFNSSGTEIDTGVSGISGGGIASGGGLSVDGNGNIWVADATGNALSEINASGTVISPANGYLGASPGLSSSTNCAGKSYAGGNLNYPFLTHIDSSGNVWVINYCEVEFNSSFYAGLTEFIGLGAPTITPLAQAVLQNQIGQRPGTPSGVSLAVTTSSLPASVNTAKYQYQLLAKGGSGSGYAWTVTSGAPTLSSVGLTLSSGGLLSGTLSGTVTGASIGVQVTDSAGNTAAKTLTLTVSALTSLSITTTNLPSATVGSSYVENFSATGGSGSYSWSMTSGASALNGDALYLNLAGGLDGTPTSTGSFPVTVQVTDLATGQTASAPYTVIVNAASTGCSNYDGSTYTVSGTVAYSGTKTGRIYLALIASCGGGNVGTSISAAGTFTIHGVPSGATFTLEAFMDTLGKGADNAADPAGSTSVTVGTGSVSGVSLTLTDPATVTLSSAPGIQSMNGFNTGVFALYNAITNSNGVEQATSYTLQWSTSSSFTTVAGSKSFPATGTHTTAWFVNGLVNGSVYYFRVYGSSAGTAVSSYSAVYGPVTVGAPTGANAVSGSVSYPGTATGPLYVGLLNSATNALYAEYFASPASAQAYTVQVPSGSYQLVAVLDQNNDGAIDAGDIENPNQNATVNVTVSGALSNQNLTLTGGNASVAVATQHYVSSSGVTEAYDVSFAVQEQVKQPVAVTLTSGPNVTVPIDIALCGQVNSNCGQGFQLSVYLGSTVPSAGNTYGFNVTYSDGTTATLSAAVSAVVSAYASGLAPTGTTGSTTPTFSWTDPAGASSYTYGFELSATNGGTIWQVPESGNLTSSTTSLVWGVDPTNSSNTPSVSSLTIGTNYSWNVSVIDSNGNQAITQANYTPSYTTVAPTISTTSIYSGSVGSSYAQTFVATGGSGSYSWSITSGLSALQGIGLSFTTGGVLSGVPTAMGSYPFTVQVTDTGTGLSATANYTLSVKSAALTSCTHDGSGNAVLYGSYAFLLSGFNPSGHFYDEIGSFKASGAGVISNGQADVNGDQNISAFAGGEQQYSFTGTYSIGSTDNRGTATFNNANGTGTAGLPAAATYCFVADTVTAVNGVGNVAASGRIVQADASGFVMTGYFESQTSPGSMTVATLNGGYAFGIQGVDGTNPNRKAMIGQFRLNGAGGVSSGQIDFSGVTYNSSTSTFVNSYTAAAAITSSGSSYTVSSGRGTMTLNISGMSMPVVFYVVGSGNQMLMMTSNNASFPLLAGKAVQQTTASFTTANVKAYGVFHANGVTNPSTSSAADKVTIGQVGLDGAGNASFLGDENTGGNISTPSSNSGTLTYTVSSIGYVVLAQSTPTNFYLYAPGGGFGLDGNLSTDLFVMLPQTIPSGGFTSAYLNTYLNGSYGLGTVSPSAYNVGSSLLSNSLQYPQVSELSGSASSGTLTLVEDTVDAPGTSSYLQLGQSQTLTYALDGTYGPSAGRVLFQASGTTGVVGYIVSPTQVVLLSVNPGQNPQLVEGEHQ